MADVKLVYHAAIGTKAEAGLERFTQAWDSKYPTIVKHRCLNWPDHLQVPARDPRAIREAIYRTNAIESVNSVIRKFTRNGKQCPNKESALKVVYLTIHEASKKWTLPIPKRRGALNNLAILFENQLPAISRNQ